MQPGVTQWVYTQRHTASQPATSEPAPGHPVRLYDHIPGEPLAVSWPARPAICTLMQGSCCFASERLGQWLRTAVPGLQRDHESHLTPALMVLPAPPVISTLHCATSVKMKPEQGDGFSPKSASMELVVCRKGLCCAASSLHLLRRLPVSFSV